MPGSVYHVYTNAVADGTATSVVRPSDWNSSHAFTYSAAGSEIVGAFSNSNGVSFGTEAGGRVTASHNALTTAMASNRGTDFVQATAAFAGTSASGTIASNGISVSIGPYITTAMLSNRGSDFVQATAAFAGTSASGTIASNGISVSIGPYITTAALSNHSHGNPQLNLTNLSGTTASNSAGFTLSLSAAAAGGSPTLNWWNNYYSNQGAALDFGGVITVGNLAIWPLKYPGDPFPGNMTVNTMGMIFSCSGGEATANQSSTFGFGIYTLNGNSLSLLNSGSTTLAYNADANMSTNWRGLRHLTLNSSLFSASLTFSNTHYWIGMTYNTGNSSNALSYVGQARYALGSISGSIGSSATATSMGIFPFSPGLYSASTNAFPAAIQHSEISKTALALPYLYFNNQSSNF